MVVRGQLWIHRQVGPAERKALRVRRIAKINVVTRSCRCARADADGMSHDDVVDESDSNIRVNAVHRIPDNGIIRQNHRTAADDINAAAILLFHRQ